MDRRAFMSAALPFALMATGTGFDTQPPSGMQREASSRSKPPLFPTNAQFWYETLRAFGAASYGGSEFGEVLITAGRIQAGDVNSWYEAWHDIAERLSKEAAEQLAHGHTISARDNYLRAATYYRASEFFLHGNTRDPRIGDAYQKTITSYLSSARLFDPPIEPVEIPYEHTTLPGYLHRVDRADRERPLLVIHTGFDGSAEEMHVQGARAAVERGYNVLAFDGPGQFGPLHRQGLHFRPDWENVVTPVVDFALKISGVDPKRIGLMGISMGGELAPRAAAFEKRIAALITMDGIFDYGDSNLSMAPSFAKAFLKERIQAKSAPLVDMALKLVMRSSPVAEWGLNQGMYAMGVSTPRAYLAAALSYNLRNGVAEKIACPTLVCDPEGDIFSQGQPNELFDHLTCPKTLLRFPVNEGAGDHCHIGAQRLALGRIFDWLDDALLTLPADNKIKRSETPRDREL